MAVNPNLQLQDPNRQAATNVLASNLSSPTAAQTANRSMIATAPTSYNQAGINLLGVLSPNAAAAAQPLVNTANDTTNTAISNFNTLSRNSPFTSNPGISNTKLTAPTASTPGSGATTPPPAPTLDQQQKDILGAGYQAPTTIDTTKSDALQQKALDAYQGTQDWTRNAALNAMANSQRAAGAASQTGGLAPGSASYLSNWRQATATGMRNLNDIVTGWQKGQSDLLNTAAAGARGVETQQGSLDYGTASGNAGGVRDIQGKLIQTGADKDTADRTAYIDSTTNTLKSYGIAGASGPTGATANKLISAYNAAPDDTSRAAAKAKLDTYLNLLAQARGALTGAGGGKIDKKYIPSNNNDAKDVETYLKWLDNNTDYFDSVK